MHYRTLGSTGIRVSAIGFGTWGIGGVTPGQRLLRSHRRRRIARGALAGARARHHVLRHRRRLRPRAQRGAAGAGLRDEASPGRDRQQGRLRRRLRRGRTFLPGTSAHSLEASLRASADRLSRPVSAAQPSRWPEGSPARHAPHAERALQREGKIRSVGVSLRSPEDGVSGDRVRRRHHPGELQPDGPARPDARTPPGGGTSDGRDRPHAPGVRVSVRSARHRHARSSRSSQGPLRRNSSTDGRQGAALFAALNRDTPRTPPSSRCSSAWPRRACPASCRA